MMVFWIEGNNATESAINASWAATNSPYPLFSTNSSANATGAAVKANYAVDISFPVTYLACPNKTVRTSLPGIASCTTWPDDVIAYAKSTCPGTTSISEVQNDNDILVYPNPASTNLSVDFNLPTIEKTSICVYDIVGKKVAELIENTYSSGFHTENINIENLSTGIYFVNIKIGNNLYTQKVSVIK